MFVKTSKKIFIFFIFSKDNADKTSNYEFLKVDSVMSAFFKA